MSLLVEINERRHSKWADEGERVVERNDLDLHHFACRDLPWQFGTKRVFLRERLQAVDFVRTHGASRQKRRRRNRGPHIVYCTVRRSPQNARR